MEATYGWTLRDDGITDRERELSAAATGEVADVFEVPLDFVLDARNHQRQSREFRGQRRHFYVLPYRHYYIWGATAAMLVDLAARLQDLTSGIPDDRD